MPDPWEHAAVLRLALPALLARCKSPLQGRLHSLLRGVCPASCRPQCSWCAHASSCARMGGRVHADLAKSHGTLRALQLPTPPQPAEVQALSGVQGQPAAVGGGRSLHGAQRAQHRGPGGAPVCAQMTPASGRHGFHAARCAWHGHRPLAEADVAFTDLSAPSVEDLTVPMIV